MLKFFLGVLVGLWLAFLGYSGWVAVDHISMLLADKVEYEKGLKR